MYIGCGCCNRTAHVKSKKKLPFFFSNHIAVISYEMKIGLVKQAMDHMYHDSNHHHICRHFYYCPFTKSYWCVWPVCWELPLQLCNICHHNCGVVCMELFVSTDDSIKLYSWFIISPLVVWMSGIAIYLRFSIHHSVLQ